MPSEINPHVGQVFDGRYKILEELGSGGMATVFLAEHTTIGRQVAVKVLSSELAATPGFTERFEREARVAGRLDHPNCVPVTDYGRLEDGTSYLVMELVKGRVLSDLLDDEGPLVVERALRIARHVLRGLGHAHSLGIVHRDIKPDNIMLVGNADDRDFARVLDFGLATLRDAECGERLTQAGLALGTPHYISTEQAVGEEVDYRSDIYSTSAVLYEMLCGCPPFDGASVVKILTKHATVTPPALAEIQPSLADVPRLQTLVSTGLAKLPDERHPDADRFVAAIDHCLRDIGAYLTPLPSQIHVPTPAPEYSTSMPTVSPKRRVFSGRHVIAGLVVVLVFSIAIGLMSDDSETEVQETPQAQFEEQLRLLEHGKSCEERKNAVMALEKIGRPEAIPALRKARKGTLDRSKPRGKRNTNQCLKKSATKAIRTLGR